MRNAVQSVTWFYGTHFLCVWSLLQLWNVHSPCPTMIQLTAVAVNNDGLILVATLNELVPVKNNQWLSALPVEYMRHRLPHFFPAMGKWLSVARYSTHTRTHARTHAHTHTHKHTHTHLRILSSIISRTSMSPSTVVIHSHNSIRLHCRVRWPPLHTHFMGKACSIRLCQDSQGLCLSPAG